jgi:hypothetical protein
MATFVSANLVLRIILAPQAGVVQVAPLHYRLVQFEFVLVNDLQ